MTEGKGRRAIALLEDLGSVLVIYETEVTASCLDPLLGSRMLWMAQSTWTPVFWPHRIFGLALLLPF